MEYNSCDSVGYLLTNNGTTIERTLLPTQKRAGFKCVLKSVIASLPSLSEWWDVYQLILCEDDQVKASLVAVAQTETLAEEIGLLLIKKNKDCCFKDIFQNGTN